MNNTIPTNLNQYFKNNTFYVLKFIRNLARNMNNTRNISSTVDKNENIEGFALCIKKVEGLYNNPKELMINSNKKYYIRYFINIYNRVTRQLYGNTYRSPLFPIKIERQSIEIKSKKPFYFYLLSQEPKNECLVLQIIIVEANQDEVILKEKCLGWALLNLIKKNADEKNDKKNFETAEINRGTPRDLILSNYFFPYPGANLTYKIIKYKTLESINFLLPSNIILSYNEPLPGLRLRTLPKIPKLKEPLITVDFTTAYIKNIVIEINPNLEGHILEFGNEYRLKKYNVEENEFNKVFIKERKIKCGIHNTWKFINTNGIENSITLAKISKNKLESSGALMIDKLFVDPLSCSAIILELVYILTIPINGPQKEDNLSLILGYSIYAPEKINAGNYSKEKLMMFTGPGNSIYGEKMWFPKNLEDKNIKISYILSQNATLNIVEKVENEEEDKKKLYALKNSLVDQNNQMILKGLQEPKSNNDEEVKNLKKKIKELEEEKNELNKKQQELMKENFEKTLNETKNKVPIKEKSKEEENINFNINKTIPTIINTQPIISKEEYKDFLQYKTRREEYVKELEEKFELLKENQKPKVSNYEEPIKNISAKDKANLIKKGILDLALKEQVDSYVDFNLGKELSEHGLATNFIFKFLAFKPSRTFYSDISKVPEKIQFFFDFFNNKKLNTPVCNVTRPEAVENNNYFLFDNQFILKRENINVNTTLLNDSKTDILIDVRYDPSIDTSIDFRDFIKYLTNKRVLIQIKDVQKCMNVGYIKVPLRDLIGQGKEKIQILKEYDIYDDNFDFRGTVQLLITAEKYKTLKEYNYNRNKFININSKEGYNTSSRKKKIQVEQMDINKLMAQNKNLYNYTMNSLKNQNLNIQNDKDMNLTGEINQHRQRKLRVDPEIEKKMRVYRYFNNKQNLGNNNTNNMNNTNYSMENLQKDERILRERKQKQYNDEQFINTLKTCEQIRDFNRSEVLSKVSQESHKNEYNISLIQGQPIYFNYSIYNESNFEELCHININKISNNNKNIFNNGVKNKIVEVVRVPKEWRTIVEKEKLKKPNSYDVLSDDLDLIIKPGETIPLLIKLLSFTENREEENYSININKKNGRPLFNLLISIKMVFPIYDHIFHYYFPFNNSDQKAILRNPFKEIKTLKLLSSMVISNKNIMLALDEDTHDFYFNINNENNSFNDDFIIFFYSDEEKTKLYLTWKIEVEWLELFNVKYKGKIGSKLASIIRINYKVEPYNEVGYAANSITLQLFSNYPDTIIFPQDSKIPFTIKPNSLEDKKFFIYPRKDEGNLAIINCVNIYTRDLYKSWIIKYEIDNPQIDDSEIIECIIGGQNVVNYSYSNPKNKLMVLSFYSSNEDILEIIDRVVTFNSQETKDIKLRIKNEKGIPRREEVLLFISDNNDDFCTTILFKIIFREN